MSRRIVSHELATGQCIELRQGDLTEEAVDAVVNAANRRLQHGGGVAGALVRRGGPVIQQQSDRWVADNGPIDSEHPAVTGGGALPCRFVIHAVGPIWGEGQEEAKLRAAVRTALETADRLGVTSLAMPAVSTGIFGFPADRAAPILLGQCESTLLARAEGSLRLVRMVLLEDDILRTFEASWRERWPASGGAS